MIDTNNIIILSSITFIIFLITFIFFPLSYIDIFLLFIILTSLFFILYFISSFGMTYVKSNIDNNLYLVQDNDDKQKSSDILAKIRNNMIKLSDNILNKLSKNNKNDKKSTDIQELKNYMETLNIRIKDSIIMESGENSIYTSYSINKGEQLVFCIRSKDINNFNKHHDINLLMYVAIHEMAHVACPEYGHTDLFKKIFKYLIEEAIELGIYKKIDFENNHTEYCGMTITDSIV